jgi:Zn-dependent peptidase ImmA (M78 family)
MRAFELGDPEQRARVLRRQLGVDELSWLDPMTIIMKAKRIIHGLSFSLVRSSDLPPNVLAQWDSKRKCICICEESFYGANGFSCNPRDRYSIFHEVIHALEGHSGTLNRATSLSQIPGYARKLKELERWTERLTASFIAPAHLIRDDDDAEKIAFKFGLSIKAAIIRLDELRTPKREGRQIPDSVAKLLLDLKKTTR